MSWEIILPWRGDPDQPILDAIVTTDHIYALARKDEIPHLRFGRTLRFRAEAIDTWLQEQEQGNRVRLR